MAYNINFHYFLCLKISLKNLTKFVKIEKFKLTFLDENCAKKFTQKKNLKRHFEL